MADLTTTIMDCMRDVCVFSETASGIKLREYQQPVARAIVESVIKKRGYTFVVIFPRQSGKNELQAQIEAYLLTLFSRTPAEIVKISPTWKPQTLNAMRRLERVLKRNVIVRPLWCKEQSYIYRVGEARLFFLSGSPTANVVGATASTLLECDEAQDVDIEKWDKEIAPMAASANATRVFWGTAWTSNTLLAREKRLALQAQEQDGVRRVFQLTANDVSMEVPSYGKFVAAEVARHGRSNPYIRTQYFSEEIDGASGMFPEERLALMQGAHPPAAAPRPGGIYAFSIDVGGEDFSSAGSGGTADAQHDSTAITVFEVDFSGIDDELQLGPRFKTVYRKQWAGLSHVSVFRQAAALAQLWNPQRIIVDATGVGEGLASLLLKTYGTVVVPFKFTQASKSDLGWKFIAMVESGRFQEYQPPPPTQNAESDRQQGDLAAMQNLFYEQCRRAAFEVLPGPGKTCRWGVPDAARSEITGAPLHDDLLLSAALAAELLSEAWGRAESAIIPSYDPIQEMNF